MMGCQKIIAFSLSYSYLTFSICFKLICISWKEGCSFTVEGAEKLTLFVRYYDNPEHMKELGGIDIGKYVGGGIVVFNLDTKQVKWTKDLDLSTDTANFRAYIYSSPNVVDLDGDGNLDILIGTSFGLFYVLDHHGNPLILITFLNLFPMYH